MQKSIYLTLRKNHMTEKHKLKPTINKSFGYEGILQFLFNLLDYAICWLHQSPTPRNYAHLPLPNANINT